MERGERMERGGREEGEEGGREGGREEGGGMERGERGWREEEDGDKGEEFADQMFNTFQMSPEGDAMLTLEMDIRMDLRQYIRFK